MKKLFLALAVIAMGLGAHAQFYAGGTIGLDVISASQDGESSTQTTFGIAPEFGYSFNKSWAVGASIGFSVASNNGDLKTVSILPYVRGTFAHVGIVDFFGEFAFGYGHQSIEDYGVSGVIFGLRPGFAINFNPKFALIARTNLFQYEYWDGLNVVDFSINKGFDLGVQFKF
ncbi:MAG: outer membrane beta-barrel protein [Muribaculaceae bacterium]|nr:outer membrane beta-barrel protein [Muribaculaceae bacterium]